MKHLATTTFLTVASLLGNGVYAEETANDDPVAKSYYDLCNSIRDSHERDAGLLSNSFTVLGATIRLGDEDRTKSFAEMSKRTFSRQERRILRLDEIGSEVRKLGLEQGPCHTDDLEATDIPDFLKYLFE